MKTAMLPKKSLGKKSIYSFVLFIVIGAAATIIYFIQGSVAEYPNIIDNPLLGITFYLTFIIAGFAFITGIIDAFKRKDDSILLYVIICLGGSFAVGGLITLLINFMQRF